MSERRSDWVEILEPRSRERMYVNLLTGECGWELPPGVPVRQSDGNQWWELFDSNSNRFYYYNCTSQQTVWHKPQGSDVVPLAQLQAMKRSSEAAMRGQGRIQRGPQTDGRHTPLLGMFLPTIPLSQGAESGRETPSSKGDSLERSNLGKGDPAQRWQPAPGSKAAMLVKVNSIGRNQSLGPATAHHLLHFSPTSTSAGTISPKPGYTPQTNRTGLLKMAVPGDSRQGFHIKKAENANFCLVLPTSSSYTAQQRSGAGTPRPSTPQYGATPSAPIYDEPPLMDHPIYDEPPLEMEVEGAHHLNRGPYSTSHGSHRVAQPPKLLQFPQSKHLSSSSANEYSPAGRECIKHMVNVDLTTSTSKHQPSNASDSTPNPTGPQIQPYSPIPVQLKNEVSLEKKQSWKLLEPRHSRQSSLASQEYPGPAAVTYQDSGYSTGPSPSLRRKNRRRATMGTGSGRPGSIGSSGELSALNEKLMAEMRAVVNRSNTLHGSKASLETEMGSEASGSTARSPLTSLKLGARGGGALGSREDVTSSNRSLYRSGGNNHCDVMFSPLVTDMQGGRQKRTFEKVDSLEKSATSQTSLSSPEPPRSPSQTGTLEPQQSGSSQDRKHDKTGHETPRVTRKNNNNGPGVGSGYQYPYTTLCKPQLDANMEDWASKNLNQHTQGLFRRRVSITNMLSWNRGSIKKPMLITSDRAVKKEACEMFKLVQAYMGDRPARLDRRHAALQVVTKCWGMQGLRDELYVQLVRQTTDNMSLRSLEAGWELMAISLAFFSPSPKFRRYLEGYIQRHLEPSNDKKILQHILEHQDIKNHRIQKNSRSRKKRKQNNEEEEEQGLPISTYAKYCYRKLQKVAITGGKKGLRKPTLEEIDHGRNAIVTPSLFGSALEEIMERQSGLFPDRKLPWVQVQLSQYVLGLGGAQTEGIFRVPGDIDEVNALKLQVDQWKIPENLSDPNVPASLLKLWYRELEEPLIPQSFYKQCISHYEDPDAAISVVQSLPELNRLVLCYFINFLQVFTQPVNVSRTKMDVNNLAMVMAPNCLRCQSDDPRIIFENTRKEMSFLRLLIVHLDTSFIKGLI
ncbi:rho GTPase-activating protein 39 isoform X1 [Triplophysa dalaica]|uniref:rho GTPase-activating protein 39 isoform X1 n=3 Tax=Triplophysa dalaica TaxID=1582913 RepID=UPI0024DF5814|nr:rho GTPase-activating protein 39 isoform X1 [Triplophysa dalaica]